MDRLRERATVTPPRCPLTRGDGPSIPLLISILRLLSPHAGGWTEIIVEV